MKRIIIGVTIALAAAAGADGAGFVHEFTDGPMGLMSDGWLGPLRVSERYHSPFGGGVRVSDCGGNWSAKIDFIAIEESTPMSVGSEAPVTREPGLLLESGRWVVLFREQQVDEYVCSLRGKVGRYTVRAESRADPNARVQATAELMGFLGGLWSGPPRNESLNVGDKWYCRDQVLVDYKIGYRLTMPGGIWVPRRESEDPLRPALRLSAVSPGNLMEVGISAWDLRGESSKDLLEEHERAVSMAASSTQGVRGKTQISQGAREFEGATTCVAGDLSICVVASRWRRPNVGVSVEMNAPASVTPKDLREVAEQFLAQLQVTAVKQNAVVIQGQLAKDERFGVTYPAPQSWNISVEESEVSTVVDLQRGASRVIFITKDLGDEDIGLDGLLSQLNTDQERWAAGLTDFLSRASVVRKLPPAIELASDDVGVSLRAFRGGRLGHCILRSSDFSAREVAGQYGF